MPVHVVERTLKSLHAWVCRNEPLLLFTCILLAVFSVVSNIDADPDLFARVSVGKLFSESGFQIYDPFSFAPKKPVWVDHEWLAGVCFYYVSQLGGDWGLLLCRYLFIAATFYFLFKAARLFSSPGIAFCSCTLAAMQTSYIWAATIRSQVFTYVFLAYLFWAIAKAIHSHSPSRLFFLPLIFMVWQQSHGGIVVGLGLYAVFCLWGMVYLPREFRKYLFIVSALCLLSTLISPYGPTIFWAYLFEATQMARPSIPEWHALDMLSLFAVGVHTFAFICLGGFLLKKKSTSDLLSAAMILLTGYYALKHQRLVALFCFAAATFGAPYLKQILLSLEDKQPRLTTMTLQSGALVLLASSVSLSLLFAVHLFRFQHLRYDDYPLQAMHWLRQNAPAGNLLVDFNSGSFAIWLGYSRFRVSLDGRYEELYTESTLHLVTEALSPTMPGHAAALKQLQPDYILQDCLDKNHCIDFHDDWHEVYQDDRFRIFTQQPIGMYDEAFETEGLAAKVWTLNS